MDGQRVNGHGLLKVMRGVVAQALYQDKYGHGLLVIKRCIPRHEDEICVDWYLRDSGAVEGRGGWIPPVLSVKAHKILVPEGCQLGQHSAHHFR